MEASLSDAVKADIIVAILSPAVPRAYFEVGWAQATGKAVIVLLEGPDNGFGGFPFTIHYHNNDDGLSRLRRHLLRAFREFREDPRRFFRPTTIAARAPATPLVDLSRIEAREFENLCFELLTQMGFRRVDWGKDTPEIDVVATLTKKDPDGFEYQELWLISMGLHAPVEMLFDMLRADPERFLHRILRSEGREQLRSSLRSDTPATFLLIPFRDLPRSDILEHDLKRMERRLLQGRYPYMVRLRLWDQQQLVNLIQQYPQLAFKYFSEEGRAQSKYRKSLDEIYRENVELNESLQVTVAALKEERDRRVKAERDAVWKDVAFKAAHKLGNPVFALETDLQGIRRRIVGRPKEALQVADEMSSSIEKAKTIIQQFKSLTRAQQISPHPVELFPILKSASRIATESGVEVEISPPADQTRVQGDPTRLAECFDELFANATHWLNGAKKHISVLVDPARKEDLPQNLDATKPYVRVRIADNGCGVPADRKEEIFAPFYTTYLHGTGLGLSIVQKIVEGHSGTIREVGRPGEGALFEMFLPLAVHPDKKV